MDIFNNLGLSLLEAFGRFGESIMLTLPNILFAILILILGWLLARALSVGLEKLLSSIQFDKLANRLGSGGFLAGAGVKMTSSQVVGRFFYWILMLLVLVSVAETLGWHVVSGEIARLMAYLPTLFSAIVLFIAGTYFATLLRDVIRNASRSLGIPVGGLISSVVFYMLFLMVALTALQHAGVDTSIITSNLLMILGAVLLSASISYSIASHKILANILAGFFSKQTFQVGQKIELDDVRGEILHITNISVILQIENGDKIIIPLSDLIHNRVKILSE